MKTYSYSKLSMFRQCPRRFYYKAIAKTKPIAIPQSAELFLGNRLHESMAFLYRNHAAGVMPALDEVLAEFDARWAGGWSDTIDLGTKGHTAASIKAVGDRAVRDYFARRQPFTDERTLGVEQPVTLWLDDAGAYRIIGRLDRLSKIADGYVITDYKSGARLPTVQDLQRDDQLWLYCLVVRQGLTPDQSVKLRWEFLRFDGETTLAPSPEQLEAVRQRTIALIEEIEAKPADPKAFPIRTSPLCGTCQFQHVCPARRHFYEISIKSECEPTLKDAAGLVDQWVDVEAERKATAAALKAVEARIAAIKNSLTLVAEQEGLAKFFGQRGEVAVTVKDELIPPRKTHEPEKATALEEALRTSPWWNVFSTVDRSSILHALRSTSPLAEEVKNLLLRYAVQTRLIDVRLHRQQLCPSRKIHKSC